MTRFLIRLFVTTLVSLTVGTASANSVGFGATEYDGSTNQVSVQVVYDFTDFAMFGGSLDLLYDTSALLFVSYTQADLPADAQSAASPVGELTDPGTYAGFGISTFLFTGINSAGLLGTFIFEVIGDTTTSDAPCGGTLCLTGNASNPFVSLTDGDVTEELLANGISVLPNLPVGVPVPVPAAFWLMVSGLMAFLPRRKRRF